MFFHMLEPTRRTLLPLYSETPCTRALAVVPTSLLPVMGPKNEIAARYHVALDWLTHTCIRLWQLCCRLRLYHGEENDHVVANLA